jgi:membrane-associated phospholipid phosphatase
VVRLLVYGHLPVAEPGDSAYRRASDELVHSNVVMHGELGNDRCGPRLVRQHMSVHLQAGSRAPSPVRAELRRDVPRLLGGAALVYLLLAGTGLLVNRVLSHGAFGRWDQGVSRWFFEHRNGTVNTLTHYGSMVSDTRTAIVVTAVLVIGLRVWRGRWRESVVVLLCIVGELTIFLGVTSTVHRKRPTVPHLDPAPPTSSFPSGHTGAAVALYVGLAVTLLLVTRRERHRSAYLLVAGLLCVLPVIVGVSRVYRGMHFVSDVVAGALAGGLWMVLVVRTLLGPGKDESDLRWRRP